MKPSRLRDNISWIGEEVFLSIFGIFLEKIFLYNSMHEIRRKR